MLWLSLDSSLLPLLLLLELVVCEDGRGEEEPKVERGSSGLGESLEAWVRAVWVVTEAKSSAPVSCKMDRVAGQVAGSNLDGGDGGRDEGVQRIGTLTNDGDPSSGLAGLHGDDGEVVHG